MNFLQNLARVAQQKAAQAYHAGLNNVEQGLQHSPMLGNVQRPLPQQGQPGFGVMRPGAPVMRQSAPVAPQQLQPQIHGTGIAAKIGNGLINNRLSNGLDNRANKVFGSKPALMAEQMAGHTAQSLIRGGMALPQQIGNAEVGVAHMLGKAPNVHTQTGQQFVNNSIGNTANKAVGYTGTGRQMALDAVSNASFMIPGAGKAVTGLAERSGAQIATHAAPVLGKTLGNIAGNVGGKLINYGGHADVGGLTTAVQGAAAEALNNPHANVKSIAKAGKDSFLPGAVLGGAVPVAHDVAPDVVKGGKAFVKQQDAANLRMNSVNASNAEKRRLQRQIKAVKNQQQAQPLGPEGARGTNVLLGKQDNLEARLALNRQQHGTIQNPLQKVTDRVLTAQPGLTVGGPNALRYMHEAKMGRTFKGVDGKPRFEIDDSKAKLTSPEQQYGWYIKDHQKTLGDVLDHPELYKQYPDLKNVNIRSVKDNLIHPDHAASYNPETNTIRINEAQVTSPDDLKALLTHETQHAIQKHEGFTNGGDVKAGDFNSYQRLAGEAEARAVQSRVNLPMSERYVKSESSYKSLDKQSIHKVSISNKQLDSLSPEAIDGLRSRGFKGVSNGKRTVRFDEQNTGKVYEAYHGTPDVRGIKEKGFDLENSLYKGAAFFTDDHSLAKSYADDTRAWDYQNAEPAVIKRHLQLDNPKVIDMKGEVWHHTQDEIAKAKEAGHDGMIIKNVHDHYGQSRSEQKLGKPSTVYVAFDTKKIAEVPEQLKKQGVHDSLADNLPNPASSNNTLKSQPATSLRSTFYDSLDVPKDQLIIKHDGGTAMMVDKRAHMDDLSPEQNKFVAAYAEILKDQGQGNGVSIHPDGRRISNNIRSAENKGKAMTNSDWFDAARAELESGKAQYGMSEDYKLVGKAPDDTPLDIPAGFEDPKSPAPATTPTEQRPGAAVSKPGRPASRGTQSVDGNALPKSTPIKVKGSMSAEDYKARFGKEQPTQPVKVKPFTDPKIDFKKWNDKNALGLGRETLERNLDRVAGKDAPAMKKLLVDSSRNNETARVQFANDLRNQTRQKIVKDLGIKAGSRESALTQQYGEGLVTQADLIHEVGTDKAARIMQASDHFRKQYDQLIDQWNVTRKRYGFDPIPKRKDYFRHFQAINQNASILGTIKNARDLPTEISGITDIFNPSKPFSDAALQRKGNKTDFDAVGGFDNYIDSVSRQIFHTDTVQKGRAVEKAIRKQAANEPTLELPNLVANLHEWTNLVSGKKTRIDRAAEELVGRKVYAASNAIRSKTGANMIGANIGSALTNFVPFTQAAATTSKTALIKAVKDTAASPFNKNYHSIDGQVSGFLTRRFPEEAISFTRLQNASHAASLPFKAIDTFTSRTIVAGKYFEGKAKGLSPQAAMKAADDYASRVITDRSVGQMPNLMETKTAGFLAQFQAEVNNQVSFLTRDIPQFANGNKLKIASSVAQFVLYSYLANEAYQHVLGRRVQLDPVHAAAVVANPKSNNRQRLDALKQDVAGGLPFTSLFTGGRLPVNAMLPDVASIGKGIGDLKKDKNKAEREIYKGVSGPVFYGLPPFGGGQLKKTAEYAQNMMKGYSETPAGTKRFDVAKDGVNTAKGLLFGQYSTAPGQAYVNGIKGGKTTGAIAGSGTLKGQVASGAKQPVTGIYQLKAKDGSAKFTTLQGSNLRSYTSLDAAKEAQAKNKFKFSKDPVTTINGQIYHKSTTGAVIKGAPPQPKDPHPMPKTISTSYDPKTNTWTQKSSLTGRTTVISADGTRTVTNEGTRSTTSRSTGTRRATTGSKATGTASRTSQTASVKRQLSANSSSVSSRLALSGKLRSSTIKKPKVSISSKISSSKMKTYKKPTLYRKKVA